MYPCTKFQFIWRTSDFQTKVAEKNMNDKNFEKRNIKFEIRTYQCMSVSNLSKFGEHWFLGPNLTKKHFKVAHYDKPNLRITYKKCFRSWV